MVPLGQQIQQFAAVQGNITELLGSPKAENHLANSLYLISVGSNDIFDNANHTNPIILLSNLTNSYANHLKVMVVILFLSKSNVVFCSFATMFWFQVMF